MEIPEDILIQIESYLNQEMEEDEARAFEARLKKEPELMSMLESHWNARKAIIAAGEQKLREELHSMKESLQAEFDQPQVRFFNQRLWIGLAIAAAIIDLLFFVFNPLAGPRQDDLFAANFNMPDAQLVRDQDPRTDPLLYEARKAYAMKDYAGAQGLYNKLLLGGSHQGEAAFYLAALTAKDEQYKKAKSLYMQLLSHPIYGTQAQKYLALIYLKTNELDSASYFTRDLVGQEELWKGIEGLREK